MTTLADLKTSVTTILAKSGLDSEITYAILSALRTLHTSGYYYRDLIESSATFPSTLFHSINYTSGLTRFRALRYLRVNVVPTGYQYLTNLPAENWGPGGTNVFTMDNLHIRMGFTIATTQVDYGYYQYPELNSISITSWIADNYPELVAQKAAVLVLNQLGQYDRAAVWDKAVKEAEANFKRDNVVGIVGV